jgi:hypothetical protein
MRVQNGAVDSPFSSSRSGAAQNVGVESRTNAHVNAGDTDFVSLSNAASLVGLAKGKIPADKQAKFDVISSQFRAGDYHAHASDVSHALVQGHLQD